MAQGSHLGRLSIVLFMDDFKCFLKYTNTLLNVDDSKIVIEISTMLGSLPKDLFSFSAITTNKSLT